MKKIIKTIKLLKTLLKMILKAQKVLKSSLKSYLESSIGFEKFKKKTFESF